VSQFEWNATVPEASRSANVSVGCWNTFEAGRCS